MIADTLKLWKAHREQAKREANKGYLAQLLELALWRSRGFDAGEYYVYPLYHIDPRPVVRVRDYVAELKRLNPVVKGVIPVDKWVQASLWAAHAIPHAQVFGFVRNGSGLLAGVPYEGESDKLVTFLRGLAYPLVVKPLDDANGRGFDMLSAYDDAAGQVHLTLNGSLGVDEFKVRYLGPGMDLLFQQKIQQHPDLARIFAPAVNSLRVVTHIDRGGHHKVLMALCKFGVGKDIIDNDEGGVIANLDLQRGILGPARKRFGSYSAEQHPDSGAPIQGVELPFWREALTLAVNAHRVVPYPKHLGWDIAIAPDGPLVIEMNAYLSLPVNQKLFGGSLIEIRS